MRHDRQSELNANQYAGCHFHRQLQDYFAQCVATCRRHGKRRRHIRLRQLAHRNDRPPTAATRLPTGPRTAAWSAHRRANPVSYTISLVHHEMPGHGKRRRHIHGRQFAHRDGDSQQRLHVCHLDRERHCGQLIGKLHAHPQCQSSPGG
jgi:hypothetical protein